MPYLLMGRALGAQVLHQPVANAMFSRQPSCIRLRLQHPLVVVVEQIGGAYWGICQIGAATDTLQEMPLIEVDPLPHSEDAVVWLSHQWRDVGLSGPDFRVHLFEVLDDTKASSLVPDAVAQLHRVGVSHVRSHGVFMPGQPVTFDFKHRQFYVDGWHGEYLAPEARLGH